MCPVDALAVAYIYDGYAHADHIQLAVAYIYDSYAQLIHAEGIQHDKMPHSPDTPRLYGIQPVTIPGSFDLALPHRWVITCLRGTVKVMVFLLPTRCYS